MSTEYAQNPDSEGWRAENWSDLLELVECLHLARIYPQACDQQDPTCGVPCQSMLCKQFAREGRRFPVAQCILKSEEGTRIDLFSRVRRRLGLLQTVIYYGEHTLDGYRFRNLEDEDLHMEIPWLRRNSDDSDFEPDRRKKEMLEVFADYRQRRNLQEFIRLLESDSGDELCPGRFGNIIKSPRELGRKFLTKVEARNHFLLVSDPEQSFFSLLFVLAEANAHGKGLGAGSLEQWLKGNGRLRSELFHDFLTEEREPGGDKDFPHHYWHNSTFERAAQALGLIKGPKDSDAQQTTSRFEKLCQWLISHASDHPIFKEVDVYIGNQKKNFAKVLRPDTLSVSGSGLDRLRSLCYTLIERLSSVCFEKDNKLWMLLNDAISVYRFPGVRFNIVGEYLLRKDESISRNYFATPLGYLNDELSQRPPVGTFAIGTVWNFETIDPTINPQAEFRIRALRTLLRALAQFGVDHAMAQLLIVRSRLQALDESARSFGHEVKQVGFALSKGWLVEPPDELKQAAKKIADTKAWVDQEWNVVPFPGLIETAGKVIRLWSSLGSPEEVFNKEPATVQELVDECWLLAKDDLKPIACRKYNCATEVDEVRNIINDVDNLWNGLFRNNVDKQVPKPDYSREHREKWMLLTRFLLSALMDCVRHGCTRGEVRVDINMENKDLMIVVKNVTPCEDEKEGLLVYHPWLESARRLASTTPLPGAIHSREVQENIAKHLGGTVERTPGSIPSSGTYQVSLKVALSQITTVEGT